MQAPGGPEVRVSNNEFSKFGTKAERNTPLYENAQLRPQQSEKKTEEKIAQHIKEMKKVLRGDTKFRHRHTENFLRISSANSNNWNAIKTQKKSVPIPFVIRGRCMPTPNTSAASSISMPSTSTGKRKIKIPIYYGPKSSVSSLSESESILVPKRQ